MDFNNPSTFRKRLFDDTWSDKIEEISHALSAEHIDLWKLRELALSPGGLVNDSLRRKAWPKLVGINQQEWHHHPAAHGGGAPSSSVAPYQSSPLPCSAAASRSAASTAAASPSQAPSPSVTMLAGWSNPQSPTPQLQFDLSASPRKAKRLQQQQLQQQLHRSGTPRMPNRSRSRLFPPQQRRQRSSSPIVHHEQPFVTSPSLLVESRNTRTVLRSCSPTPGRTGHRSSSSSRRRRKKSESSQLRLPPILARSLDSPHVELDVSRCTWHLLTGTERMQRVQMEHKRHKTVARHIKIKQRRLSNLINAVLVQSYHNNNNHNNHNNHSSNALSTRSSSPLSSKLRYYQGFHDVACIFLSVLENKVKKDSDTHWNAAAAAMVADSNNHNNSTSANIPLDCKMQTLGLGASTAVLGKVSQSHFRTYMQSSFLQLKTVLSLTIFPLLALLDPELHDHLYSGDMTEPIVVLPWVITWFSREFRDTELVKRIFDAFLVSHPLLPLYTAVAVMTNQLNRREVIETECEFAALHKILSSLPKNSSMVGWKYNPGAGGYVSDNESSVAESSCSTCSVNNNNNNNNNASNSQLFNDSNEIPLRSISVSYDEDDFLCLDNTTFTTNDSVGQNSLGESEVKVPFQEIMDAAVHYMERIPPKDILHLATRYHGKHHVEELLRNAGDEDVKAIFATPQAANLHATVKADWLLREQARDERVNGKPIREGPFSSAAQNQRQLAREQQRLRQTDSSSCRAASALGCAVGDKSRRQRRKRNRAVAAVFAMGAVCSVVSVAVTQTEWNFPEVPQQMLAAQQVREEQQRQNAIAKRKAAQEYANKLQREQEAAEQLEREAALELARLEETEKVLFEISKQAELSMKLFEEETQRRAQETSAETKRMSSKAKSDLARLRVREKTIEADVAPAATYTAPPAQAVDEQKLQVQQQTDKEARLVAEEEARAHKKAEIAEAQALAKEQAAEAERFASEARTARIEKARAAKRAAEDRVKEEGRRAAEEIRLAREATEAKAEKARLKKFEREERAQKAKLAKEAKRLAVEKAVAEKKLLREHASRAALEARRQNEAEKLEKARIAKEAAIAKEEARAEEARVARDARALEKIEKARAKRELKEMKANAARELKETKAKTKLEKGMVLHRDRGISSKISRIAQIDMHHTPAELLNFFEGGVDEFKNSIKGAPTSRLFRIIAILGLDVLILVAAAFL